MSRQSKDKHDIALRKIFIGGLSYGTDDDKLRQYFQVYGTVQDAVVMKDPVSRRSRGFGFITFTDMHAVDVALAHDPHTIDSRKVEAKRAVPRAEGSRELQVTAKDHTVTPSSPVKSKSTSPPPLSPATSSEDRNSHSSSAGALDPKINMEEYAYNKVFVGGLHYDTRDAEFRAYFEQFGRVLSAEVMFNRETHKSRGFGFIVFENERGAELVCSVSSNVIDGKVVEVKRAVPRSKLSQEASPKTNSSKSNSIASRTDLRRTASVGSVPQSSGGLPPRTVKSASLISQTTSPLNASNMNARPSSYAAALSQGSRPIDSAYAQGGRSSMYRGLFDDDSSVSQLPRASRAHSEPTIQVVSLDSLLDDYFDYTTGSIGSLTDSAHNDIAQNDMRYRSSSVGSIGGGDLSRRSSFSNNTSIIGSPVRREPPGLMFEDSTRERASSGSQGWMPSHLSPQKQERNTFFDSQPLATANRIPMQQQQPQQPRIGDELRRPTPPMTALMSLQQANTSARLDFEAPSNHNQVPSQLAWASFTVSPQQPPIVRDVGTIGSPSRQGGSVFGSSVGGGAFYDYGQFNINNQLQFSPTGYQNAISPLGTPSRSAGPTKNYHTGGDLRDGLFLERES